MPRMSGGVKTGRYYVRLPEETIAEIDGYIKDSGMYQAYFLSNALIVGARIMARQLNPERFYTHEMVEAIAARSGRATQRNANEHMYWDASVGRESEEGHEVRTLTQQLPRASSRQPEDITMPDDTNISAEENRRQMRSRFDAVNQASDGRRQTRRDAVVAHDAEEKRRRSGLEVASSGRVSDTPVNEDGIEAGDASGMDENDSLGG